MKKVGHALNKLYDIAHESEDDELANTLYWERESAWKKYNG